ncbi:MAG: phosphotransferase [Acidimicrobiales bacterium]|nr:ecdysteroid 22-kinase family protein [Acidimicrobiales bacterium]MDG1844864.1 phosphotransferase [Acidimicrobiales bacterium]
MVDIPKSFQEVTASWLSEILASEIESISAKRIGEGIGLMGDIYSVELTYKSDQGDGPASVVVKLPSSYEENREQGVALGMFEAEVRFYNELGLETGTGLPEIYFAKIKPGTADFVIVMEDLSNLIMVDQSTGMSFEQALAAVRVLAKIHAVWWGKVQTDALDWIPSMIGPRIEYVDQVLPQIYPVFAEAFTAGLPEGGAELMEEFSRSYLSLNGILAERSPWTLAHQDYRVENMLFGDTTEDHVVVIDWQGIGRGPGAYDLAYLLGGSMDTSLRRIHEKDLVTAYHAKLNESGVEGYSSERAWEDYGFAHLLGGLATSIFAGGTLDLSNERGVELITMMANRHVTAALDHGGFDRTL